MKAWLLSTLLLLIILAPSTSSASTDFNQILPELERQYQLPTGCLAKIARIESGGRNVVNAQTGNAAGVFQWTRDSWRAVSRAVSGTGGPLDDSQRFNPSVAAKVTAVHAKDNFNNLRSLISQARIDPCVGIYMGHFLGLGGARRFLSFYVQNPQANACREFPRECRWNAGLLGGNRTLAGVLQEISRRMGAGGSIQVTGNFEDRNGIPYSRTNADIPASAYLPASTPIVPDTQRTYPTTYLPTGLANPQQPTLPLVPNSAFSPANQPSVVQKLLQAVLPQFQSQTQTQGQTTQTGAPTSTAATIASRALIIAQPPVVARGNPIIVSWTSVGMKTDAPCVVRAGSLELAKKNEGTKIVSTNLTNALGPMTFTLSCTSQSGQNVERSTSATIR